MRDRQIDLDDDSDQQKQELYAAGWASLCLIDARQTAGSHWDFLHWGEQGVGVDCAWALAWMQAWVCARGVPWVRGGRGELSDGCR